MGSDQDSQEHATATHQTRVTIRGRVQGVFFRAETVSLARRLGVKGYVRNMAGGTVEAVFAGNPAHVETMLQWSRTGPTQASVTRIEITQEPLALWQGFEKRR